jgi:hypothetical protein
MKKLILAAAIASLPLGALGEVTASGDDYFSLRQDGLSPLPPAALWQRLVQPGSWWSPAHSYSGDAQNLSLDLRVGGYWQESWEGGAVAHGRVILLQPEKMLRLEAPFGPLQGLGTYSVWTITLSAERGGTRVVFEETSMGVPGSALDKLAPAVDAVKTEAMKRLVAAP